MIFWKHANDNFLSNSIKSRLATCAEQSPEKNCSESELSVQPGTQASKLIVKPLGVCEKTLTLVPLEKSFLSFVSPWSASFLCESF